MDASGFVSRCGLRPHTLLSASAILKASATPRRVREHGGLTLRTLLDLPWAAGVVDAPHKIKQTRAVEAWLKPERAAVRRGDCFQRGLHAPPGQRVHSRPWQWRFQSPGDRTEIISTSSSWRKTALSLTERLELQVAECAGRA